MRAAAVLNDGVALALVGKIDHATTVAEGGKGPIILGLEGGRDGLGLYHRQHVHLLLLLVGGGVVVVATANLGL